MLDNICNYYREIAYLYLIIYFTSKEDSQPLIVTNFVCYKIQLKNKYVRIIHTVLLYW